LFLCDALLKLFNVGISLLLDCGLGGYEKTLYISDLSGEALDLGLQGALLNTLVALVLALVLRQHSLHFV